MKIPQFKRIAGSMTSVETVNLDSINTGANCQTLRSETLVNETANSNVDHDKTLQDKEIDHKKTPFYEASTPLIVSMKLSGLYYVKPVTCKLTVQQVYCWILALIPCACMITEASVIRFIKSIDINCLILAYCFSFTSLCAANAVTFIRNSQNPKYVRKFSLGFERLNSYGGPFLQSSQVKKFVKITSLVSWVVYCAYLYMVGHIVFSSSIIDFVLQGVGLPMANSLSKIILMLVLCIMGLQWVFTCSMQLCVGAVLFLEYRKFYKAFISKLCKDNHKQIQLQHFEMERKRYVQMARTVEAADKMLALHHGASFACNISNLCLLLYVIAYYSSLVEVSVLIVLFLLAIGDIAVVCISGILVNVTVNNTNNNKFFSLKPDFLPISVTNVYRRPTEFF